MRRALKSGVAGICAGLLSATSTAMAQECYQSVQKFSEAGGRFGQGLAVQGDRALITVNEGSGDISDPRGYIFEKIGDDWVLQASLRTLPGWTHRLPAAALDGNVAIGGAPSANVSGTVNAGAVLIYRRQTATNWHIETRLSINPPIPDLQFGFSVAVQGDLIVVGAPFDDRIASNAGSAYIFRRVSGTWQLEQHIPYPQAAAGGYFGYAVLIIDDQVLISATQAFQTSISTGNVFIYQHDGSAWKLQQTISGSGLSHSDEFGAGMAHGGGWLAVTAPDFGGAYVFSRTARGAWTESGRICRA